MKIKNLKLKIVYLMKWLWATLPRRIVCILVIATLILSSIWYLFLKPAPVEAGWWDEDWLYRRAVVITNSTTAETDVFISFDEDTTFINTDSDKFQADCGDLRFTKRDGTQLDYYIVSGCGGASTIVHVKLDMLQAGDQTIYFYYGNPSADNGFIGTGFSTEASSYSIGTIQNEETGTGPVLWLKFDEGYGTTAYDSSEQNNDGTLEGDPSWTDSGKFGKALNFDGSGDYVHVGDIDTEVKTVTLWIRPNAVNVTEEPLDLNGDAYVKIASGIVTGEEFISPTVYVNGIVASTVTTGWNFIAITTGTGIDATDLDVGRLDAVYFNGIIDEVKIYPYARSAAQIKRDYNKGASARIGRDDSWLTDGLVGYWKMDEASWVGDADEVEDSSGAGNHGVRAGDATTTGTAKFGKAGTFDGTGDYVDVGNTGETEIKTVSLWIKPDAVNVTEEPLDLNGDAYVKITDGTVTGHGFTSPTVYINGVVGSTVTTSWNLVTITTSTGINANDLDIGRLDAVYFDGNIDDVRIYNRELSGFEVARLYDWGPPPVGHWKFDEGSGSSANDSSENANTGTITGATWKNAAECKFGNCLDFENSNDHYVTIPDSTLWDFTGPFSLVASIKLESLPATSVFYGIISRDWSSPYPITLRYFRTDGDVLELQFGIDGVDIKYGWTATVGVDYHLVALWDGAFERLYINGVEVDNVAQVAAPTANSDPFYIGLDYRPANNRSFDGLIDHVIIYNYARTQKQIVEDMMGGRPGITETTSSPGAMAGYWKFDEGYGIIAYDASGRDNDLDFSASTEAWTMSGKFGKAWDGDGSKYLSIADDPDFDFTATEDFSISGWFKHNYISSSNDYIIAKHESGGGYKVYMDSDGDIAFAIDDDETWDTTDVIGNDQGRDYDDNAWHYFAAVKRGTSSMRLYVDGREIDNDTDLAETGSLVNTDLLYVGIDSDASTGAFDGELDEIKIYRFALTPEEILLDYNKGKSVIMGAVGTELQGAADQKPAFGTSGSQLNTDHPLADGLVGLWLMNEGTGDEVFDLSGNDNTGTFQGTAPSWTSGKFGSAVDLPGTNEYIQVADSDSLNGKRTIIVWFKPTGGYDSGDGDEYLFTHRTAGGVLEGIQVKLNTNDGTILVDDDPGVGGHTTVASTITSWNDEWYMLAITADGTNMTMYINGVYENSTAFAVTFTDASNTLVFGADRNGDTTFVGLLDIPSMYDRALSAQEIKWLYAEPFAMLNLPTVPSFSQNRAYCPPGHVGLCNPPVGEYKFDERTGATAYDTSSNTNNGTITGATWKGSGDCKYNGCLDFDGDGDYVDCGSIPSIANGGTISVWFKTDNTAQDQMIIEFSTESNDRNIMQIRGSVGNVEVRYYDGTSYNGGSVSIDTGWHHLVYIKQNGVDAPVGYLDGILMTGTAESIGSFGNNKFIIGSDTAKNADFFDGQIDDVKIFDYALTQEQVAWIYNKGSPVGQWKFDEGEGPITYNSTTNDGGKLPGLRLDTDHSLSNGLVGVWLMNENTGTTVHDLSGNGQTATFDAGDPPTWGAGKYGPAVISVDEYILGTATASNTSPGDITIIAWYMPTGMTSTYGIVVSNGPVISSSSLVGSGWVLGHGYNGDPPNPHFWIGPDAANEIRIGRSPSYPIPMDEWAMIAGVFESSSKTGHLYINGEHQESKQNANTTSYANTAIKICGASSNAAYALQGSTSHVMIYNRALSAAEIAQLYAEPFAMISDTGASLITGADWSSGKYNSALDFDGDDDVVTVAVDSDIDLNNKTGYSVCGWINPDSDGEGDPGAGEWFSKGDSYIRVDTEIGTTLEVSALFDLESGGNDASLNTTQTIPIGSWSHICTTWKDDDDDELTIYINGINAGSSTNGSGAPFDDSASHLNIGGDSDKNFDGDIDEVTIYNYELTSEQVKLDYNQGSALRFGD